MFLFQSITFLFFVFQYLHEDNYFVAFHLCAQSILKIEMKYIIDRFSNVSLIFY